MRAHRTRRSISGRTICTTSCVASGSDASTRVVALNLPNWRGTVVAGRLPVLERGIMQRIAVSTTDRINTLTSQNVMVIDLMCDARSYNSSLFSSDGFHPSDSGYALMAGKLLSGAGEQRRAKPVILCPQPVLVARFLGSNLRSGSSATVASAFRRDPKGAAHLPAKAGSRKVH